MDPICLVPMTASLYHRYFQGFERDLALYMDESLFQPFQYDPAWVNAYIRRQQEKKRLPFAILQNDAPVGEILLKDIEENEGACTLSIHFQSDAVKGRGIGTAAERLIIAYAFETLGLRKIYADCVIKNTTSQHVLEKAGFRKIRADAMLVYYQIDRECPENA